MRLLTILAALLAAPLYAQDSRTDRDAKAALALQAAAKSPAKPAAKAGCACAPGSCKCDDHENCPAGCPTLAAQAKAALYAAIRPELIAAPRKMPADGPDLTQPLTVPEAVKWTKQSRQPVLVRVGNLECSALCPQLRPEIPVCHAYTLPGDADVTPHLRLICADAKGDVYLSGQSWHALPSERQVRDAAAALKREVDAPKVPVTAAPLFGGPCKV